MLGDGPRPCKGFWDKKKFSVLIRCYSRKYFRHHFLIIIMKRKAVKTYRRRAGGTPGITQTLRKRVVLRNLEEYLNVWFRLDGRDGRNFRERFKSYVGSQISWQLLNEVHIYPITVTIIQRDCRKFLDRFKSYFGSQLISQSLNNNNNDVHLSCAHQRPERSHDTY